MNIMEEYAREPCPWRIIDDCGGAFSMGLIGGGFFNMIGGARNAPRGITRRLKGGVIRVTERAHVNWHINSLSETRSRKFFLRLSTSSFHVGRRSARWSSVTDSHGL